MAQQDSITYGFRAIRRHPAIFLVEPVWRWSFVSSAVSFPAWHFLDQQICEASESRPLSCFWKRRLSFRFQDRDSSYTARTAKAVYDFRKTSQPLRCAPRPADQYFTSECLTNTENRGSMR